MISHDVAGTVRERAIGGAANTPQPPPNNLPTGTEISAITYQPQTIYPNKNTVTFQVTVTEPADNGQTETYAWDFGDGSAPQIVTGPTGGSSATHVYTTSGTFPVTVRVTGHVAFAATSINVVVLPPPPNPPLTYEAPSQVILSNPFQYRFQTDPSAVVVQADCGVLYGSVVGNVQLPGLVVGPNGAGDWIQNCEYDTIPGVTPQAVGPYITIKVSENYAGYGTLTSETHLTPTLVDISPPILTVPGNVTVPAQSANGANVTLRITAADPNFPGATNLALACFTSANFNLIPQPQPPNDTQYTPITQLFPIGTTNVSCQAKNYAALFAYASFSVTVEPQLTQTITFSHPQTPPLTTAMTFIETATSSVGFPVTVVSTAPAVCTVGTNNMGLTGPSVTVTIMDAGTCQLQMTQPGNGYYAAAPTVTDSVLIKYAGMSGSITLEVPTDGRIVPGASLVADVGLFAIGAGLNGQPLLPPSQNREFYLFFWPVNSSGNPVPGGEWPDSGVAPACCGPTGYTGQVVGTVPTTLPSSTYKLFVFGDDAAALTGTLPADIGYPDRNSNFVYPTLASPTLTLGTCSSTLTSKFNVTRGSFRFVQAQSAFLETDTIVNTSGSAIAGFGLKPTFTPTPEPSAFGLCAALLAIGALGRHRQVTHGKRH